MGMEEQEIRTEDWQVGSDMPARNVARAAFLIDGRMTMLEMCVRFLSAKHSIYIAAWGLSQELLLVRGKHSRAGEDGSPEQEELLRWLREKGLADEDLRFWESCEQKSVANVLQHAASKGVDVRVLLWDTYTLPFQTSPKDVRNALESVGVKCLLDDSHLILLNHPLEAHHQKTVTVDGRYSFVGGIDMMVQNGGDFDRWDTKGHPYHTPLRLDKDGNMPHCWHDAQILFEGPAVADVELNFCQRWNEVVELHKEDVALHLQESTQPLTSRDTRIMDAGSRALIQVTRTIPKGTYGFAPEEGISTILESYQRAFAQAKRHIYIENQYFWRRTFLGLENPTFGVPHPDMERLMQTLADAMARGVVVTLILPDNPNVGREFTDEGLKYLHELAPGAAVTGALHTYTLGTCYSCDDRCSYRSIYVHAKIAIVDDLWLTIGSANLNNRGMRDDTEINILLMQPGIARALRIVLMAEHLGLADEDTLFQVIEAMSRAHMSSELSGTGDLREATFMQSLKKWSRSLFQPNAVAKASPLYGEYMRDELGALWEKLQEQVGDPFGGMALLTQQAKENLLAIKAGKPLVGHLLPYIPYEQAKDYDVAVDGVNGWLDALSEP